VKSVIVEFSSVVSVFRDKGTQSDVGALPPALWIPAHWKKHCLKRIPNCLEVEWFFLHQEVTTQFTC